MGRSIPNQNQAVVRVTEELVGLCATLAYLEWTREVHFESTVLHQALKVENTHTVTVKPFNRSIVSIAKILCQERRGFWNNQFLWPCMIIAQLSSHILEVSPIVLMFGRLPKLPVLAHL